MPERLNSFMNMDVTALAAAIAAIILAFFKGSGFRQAIKDLKKNVVYEDRFVEYKDANKEQHDDLKASVSRLESKIDVLIAKD